MKLCPEVKYFEHGKTKGYNNQIGSVVQFICDDGYERQGNQFVMCQQNGEWSADIPTCKGNVGYNCVHNLIVSKIGVMGSGNKFLQLAGPLQYYFTIQ